MKRLLILNPNASVQMTHAIAETAAGMPGVGFEVDVRRVPESPPSLETFYEYGLAAVASLTELRRLGLTHDSDRPAAHDGVLLACFGDPGLYALKESCLVPVVGMAEAALSTALLLGYRFALLVALPRAVPMMDLMLRQYGLRERCGGIYPLGLPVLELESGPAVERQTLEAGRRAMAEGADLLVLGCAGLTGRARWLQQELGLPVVDPILAGYLALEGLIRSGLAQSRAGMFDVPPMKPRQE